MSSRNVTWEEGILISSIGNRKIRTLMCVIVGGGMNNCNLLCCNDGVIDVVLGSERSYAVDSKVQSTVMSLRSAVLFTINPALVIPAVTQQM